MHGVYIAIEIFPDPVPPEAHNVIKYLANIQRNALGVGGVVGATH